MQTMLASSIDISEMILCRSETYRCLAEGGSKGTFAKDVSIWICRSILAQSELLFSSQDPGLKSQSRDHSDYI